MKELLLNEVIRQARIEHNYTLEKLSEGICEVETLSRIETGKNAPTLAHAQALLAKLGLPPARFFAIQSKNDERLHQLQLTLETLQRKFQWAAIEKRSLIKEDILANLLAFEELIEDGDVLSLQYAALIRTVIGQSPDGSSFSSEALFPFLLDAIHLNAPRFQPENAITGVFDLVTYHLILHLGRHLPDNYPLTADEYYQKLLSYIEAKKESLPAYVRYHTATGAFCSEALFSKGEYLTALQVSTEAKNNAVYYVYSRYLPELSCTEARCLYELQHKESSLERYQEAYYLCRAIGNDYLGSILKNEIVSRFQNVTLYI